MTISTDTDTNTDTDTDTDTDTIWRCRACIRLVDIKSAFGESLGNRESSRAKLPPNRSRHRNDRGIPPRPPSKKPALAHIFLPTRYRDTEIPSRLTSSYDRLRASKFLAGIETEKLGYISPDFRPAMDILKSTLIRFF